MYVLSASCRLESLNAVLEGVLRASDLQWVTVRW